MFYSASAANPDTSGWNTKKVTKMSAMFWGAISANPDVSSWDTGAVTTMGRMFDSATSFDRDIGSWDVTALLDAQNMFNGVTISQTNYDSLLIGWNAQTLQPGVTFSGGNSTYCSEAAIAARANMISSDSWVITDGGLGSCPPANPNVAPDLTPDSDTGISNSDNFTLDNTPDFFVNCSATDIIITLYTDHPAAKTAVGNHTCVGAGTEIAAVTAPLSGGVHNITYTEKNGGGESGQSPALVVTVDLLFKEGFEASVQ
jgi:surface protein